MLKIGNAHVTRNGVKKGLNQKNTSPGPEKKQTFTHFDDVGRARMVDVSDKLATYREATASCRVQMDRMTRQQIEAKAMKKGDVLGIAEIAGVMGAKRTADLIPLCHPLPISKVAIALDWSHDVLENEQTQILVVEATVATTHQTGVEMEALTACTTAALTVYDMCKAIDRAMRITDVHLVYKSGGRSGEYDVRAQSGADS